MDSNQLKIYTEEYLVDFLPALHSVETCGRSTILHIIISDK